MKEVRLNITKTVNYECIVEMSNKEIDIMRRMTPVEFHQFILEKMDGPQVGTDSDSVRTDSDTYDPGYEIL